MRKTQEALVCVASAYFKLETYIFVSIIPPTAQVSLHICAGSPEQSLFENAIGVKSSEYTCIR